MSPDHENAGRLATLFQGDLFARFIDVELVEWAGGTATARATPGSSHENFVGSTHGGFIFAAADVALGVASNSWGRIAVAVSIGINYLAPAATGESLEISATEVSRGRNLGTYALEVRRGAKLLTTATGVTFRTDKWHFGPEAWTDSWRAEH